MCSYYFSLFLILYSLLRGRLTLFSTARCVSAVALIQVHCRWAASRALVSYCTITRFASNIVGQSAEKYCHLASKYHLLSCSQTTTLCKYFHSRRCSGPLYFAPRTLVNHSRWLACDFVFFYRFGITGAYVALVFCASLWRCSLRVVVDHDVLHLAYLRFIFFSSRCDCHSDDRNNVLQSLNVNRHCVLS